MDSLKVCIHTVLSFNSCVSCGTTIIWMQRVPFLSGTHF